MHVRDLRVKLAPFQPRCYKVSVRPPRCLVVNPLEELVLLLHRLTPLKMEQERANLKVLIGVDACTRWRSSTTRCDIAILGSDVLGVRKFSSWHTWWSASGNDDAATLAAVNPCISHELQGLPEGVSPTK